MQDSVGVIGALGIARNLGAQRAAGVRMIGIAGDLDRHAFLHVHEHRAGVGAIVGAGGVDDAGGGEFGGGVHGRKLA